MPPHSAEIDPAEAADHECGIRCHHKDRPDDLDMILLLRRPNYAALDQNAKMAAGYGKHFGSPEAAAAKKRTEFRKALDTRL